MTTRRHVHEETFPVTPERLFALLHTPREIREWWGAAHVIVIPRQGGIWTAAWGEDENSPDYIASATLRVFDPPKQMVFDDYTYYAKSGPLPFEADFVTEFTVESRPEGAALRVVQNGFPSAPEADDFFAACEAGWRETFHGIRFFLSSVKAKTSAR